MLALVDHERALELDHHLAVLIRTRSLYADNADVRPRLRLPCLEHLAARVDRVALEHGIRQPNLVPAEVRHHIERKIDGRLASDERQGKGRVYEGSAEL